jgi:hypothetical protein
LNPYALRRRNLNGVLSTTDEDSREVTSALDDAGQPSEALQPPRAAASFDGSELRELVADLRAMIADLRADNRRLREQLGERVADVIALDAKRRDRG